MFKKLLFLTLASFITLHLNSAVKDTGHKFYRYIKDKSEYDKTVKNGYGIHVVKYYADWCGACQHMQKLYNEVAGRYKSKNIDFCAIDISKDEFKPLLEENKIEAIPTTLFIKDGKETHRERGSITKQELDNQVRSLISKR